MAPTLYLNEVTAALLFPHGAATRRRVTVRPFALTSTPTPSMKFAPYFSFFLLAMFGRMAQATPLYSVTDLGDFAGGEDYSQAFDLNASGQVVGVGRITSRFRAFLSSTGSGGESTLVDLGSLPGLPGSRANGINSLGQIVGASTDGDKTRAFLWNPIAPNSSEGSMMELPDLPGERNSASATAVNSMGQVVGYSRGQAYLWTPDVANGTAGAAVDLGALPGATASLAIDVNDSGQVAGISFTSGERAFLWTPVQPNGNTGSMVDLGSLPDGNGVSQAVAINGAGAVVGHSMTSTGQHAVLWLPGTSGTAGALIDLGDLEGGNDLSSATGVNAANQVVGNSNSSDSEHAFLWTEADGMLDLNSLTDATGAAWILRYAQSINDHGQIVGWGTFDPDGPARLRRSPTFSPGPGKCHPAASWPIFPPECAFSRETRSQWRIYRHRQTERKIIIRGLGPSLGTGMDGLLPDPVLELYQDNVLLARNDNWRDTQAAEIAATTIPPANDLESAIVRTLNPGAYSAVLRGRSETSGTGLVEVYDLGLAANSKLANISTRGFVGTADNAMIGGLIVSGDDGQTAKVIVRAIGPSLSDFGVSGALPDPALELRDGNGALIASNDNWRSDHEAEIIATNLPPSRDAESAIIRTLVAGNYTAIVRGINGATGVGLVEVYNLQ